jgi:hypothetical protein
MGDGWQATTALNRARQAVQRLAHIAEDVVNPFALAADVASTVRTFTDPPAGDPDAVLAAASTYAATARTAHEVKAALDRIAKAHLPAVAVGVAAGTAAQAVSALAQGAGGVEEGAGIADEALRRYAGELRTAQSDHATGRGKIEDGLSDLTRCVDTYDVFGLPTPIVDLPATYRHAKEALETVLAGARTCLRAYEHVDRELHTLRRWLTDSAGYARLAGVDTPPGFTVLDVAVVSVQYLAADDPDRAVLDDAKLANLTARLGAMTPAERARLDAALAGLDDPLARSIVLSAIAAGASIEQAEFLAASIRGMSTADLRTTFSLDTDEASPAGTPAFVDGTPIDQTDQTTCGSTSLVVLMAQSDPLLALWLRTGKRPPGYEPSWLAHLTPDQWAAKTYDERLTLVELAMKTATNENELLPGGSRFPWPGAAGTPPWGAADALDRTVTTTGSGYESVMIDDQDPSLLRDTLTRAAVAANAGNPVPLYVGGDSSDGLDATIPRHVVLITGYHRGVYTIYEPSSGQQFTVPEQELLDGGGPSLAAFGNWTHPDWIVLPTDDPR